MLYRLISLANKLRESLGRTHETIQKISTQIDAATAEYKSENAKERPAQTITAILNRPQSEIDNEEARASHEEKRKTREEGRDRVRLWIEGIALGAGVIVAGANIGLWIVTSHSVNISAIAARAAQEGARASVEQANAAKQSINATVNQFHLDQRAWLGIDGIDGIPTKGQPFVIKFDVKNTGKTPATNVRVWKHCQPHVRIPNVQAECQKGLNGGFSKVVQSSNAILNPGGTYILALYPNKGEPLTQDLTDVIGKGQLFYIYGCIVYSDIFKSDHWLTYCNFWDDHSKGYAPCEKYNEAGDGPPPT